MRPARRLTGLAIKAAREFRGSSRQQLADQLSRVQRTTWTAGMVSKLENGLKAATPDIVRALHQIQQMPYRWYCEGLEGIEKQGAA